MNCLNKRIFSLALAAAMCTGLSVPALAANESAAPERGILTYSDMIVPQYEDAQPFYEGLAAVKKNGKWGYIDKTGKTVIPFTYDIAYAFNEGRAIVGTFYTSVEYDDYVDYVDYDENGELTGTKKVYNYYKVGFIDKTGAYKPFQSLMDGYDPVTGESLAEPSVFISQQENTVIDPFDYIFYNGYIAIAEPDGPYIYLYNTEGKVVCDQSGEALSPYGEVQVTEGTIRVGNPMVYDGGSCYYDLNTGKYLEVQPPKGYDETAIVYVNPMNQGMALAEVVYYDKNDNLHYKFGFINNKGAWVIQPQFEKYFYSGVHTNYRLFGETGLAMVSKGEKYGAIDKTGKTVIPFQYEELWPIGDGLMVYRSGGKYGYLNADGTVAIKPQFEKASGFQNGIAAVYDGQKASLIDTKGALLPGSENLSPDSYFFESDNGDKIVLEPDSIVVIEKNGKYGYGSVDYLKPLPEKDEMSSWAFEEVSAAIEKNLIPAHLQNLYKTKISRESFCEMAVQTIQEVTGKEIADVVKERTGKTLDQWCAEYPFKDSTNSNIIAAYALGIVNGRGNGVFDPYMSITRQEAAAFLMRSAAALGMDTSKVAGASFKDEKEISSWFKEAVNFVSQINVMGGTGKNQFSPKGSYTREQSYVTAYRLFQAVLNAPEK